MRVNSFIAVAWLTLVSMSAGSSTPSTALPSPTIPGTEAVPPELPVVRGRFDVEKLEVIQAETLILEAQALRAKAEIAASGGMGDGKPSPSATAVASGPSDLPRIREIAGGSRLSAQLIMPDNAEIQVFTGQTIATTDMTISNITAQGVVVTRTDGSTVSLPMNSH